VRVLIVDHSRGIRDRLSVRLRDAGLEVVAEAATGAEALSHAVTAVLDAIVLDVLLPDRHGLDLLPSLRGAAPRAVIMILTNAPEYASHCLAQGADIVLDKSRDFDAVAGVLIGRAARG
jgi:DNA-binding NarL/FixJ family response regulator